IVTSVPLSVSKVIPSSALKALESVMSANAFLRRLAKPTAEGFANNDTDSVSFLQEENVIVAQATSTNNFEFSFVFILLNFKCFTISFNSISAGLFFCYQVRRDFLKKR